MDGAAQIADLQLLTVTADQRGKSKRLFDEFENALRIYSSQ